MSHNTGSRTVYERNEVRRGIRAATLTEPVAVRMGLYGLSSITVCDFAGSRRLDLGGVVARAAIPRRALVNAAR